MKYKYYLLLICGFLLVGCSNNKVKSLKCSLSDNSEIVEIKYKDKKLIKLKETTLSKTDDIDSELKVNKEYANIFKNVDGINLKVTKEDSKTIKTVLNVDFTKIDATILKEKIGENFDSDNLLKLKKMDINTFKKEYLKNYTCE